MSGRGFRFDPRVEEYNAATMERYPGGNDVVHKDTGRIYRITSTEVEPENWAGRYDDLAKMSDEQLANLQTSKSAWHARRARVILQHRSGSREIDASAMQQLQLEIELVERHGSASSGHDAAMGPAQLARLMGPARVGDHPDFPDHALDIVGYADGLVGGVEALLQTGIMGRNASRAGILVALQRLDAAKGQHETARGADKVGTDAQRPGHVGRGYEFATGNYLDSIAQAVLFEQVDDERQAFLEWQTNIVHEAHGRCACASIAAVDRYEVGCRLDPAVLDLRKHFVKPTPGANDCL